MGLGISILSLGLRVLKWKILVDVDYKTLIPIQLFGMTLSNFTPGKVGEPAKTLILRASTGTPVSKSLPTVIWERVLDIIVLLLLSSLFLQSATLTTDVLNFSYIGIGIFLAILVLAVSVLLHKGVGEKLFSLLRKLPLLKKINEDFIDSFYSNNFKKRKLIFSFIVTLGAWVLDSAILYLMLLSLGFEISILVLAGVIAISTIIGVASALPGGLGTSEAISSLLLISLGVPNVEAVAAVFLFRALSLWFGSFTGGLSFIYLSKKLDLNLKELIKQ
jgi:glycosyltransferase 2 family protein